MSILEANGETLFYIREGEGPAVVLVHSLGTGADLWRGLIHELRDRYQLVAFDCRCHGQSSGNGRFSIENVVDDLKAGLDVLGVEAAHMVGLSMGGAICLTFHSRWPQRVHSLVLAGTIAQVPPDVAADRLYAIQEALHYLRMEGFAKQYAGDTLCPSTAQETRQELVEMMALVDRKRYLEALKAVLAADVNPLLDKVNIPALVLVGERDKRTPIPEAEHLAKNIAGARMEVIPEAGHLCNLDNPEAFNAAAAKFLDAQELGLPGRSS